MPRDKATPVKRGVDRFHDSVRTVEPVLEIVSEESEDYDASEVADDSADESEEVLPITITSIQNQAPIERFSCELFALDAEWTILGRKNLPNCCNDRHADAELQLFPGGMLMLTFELTSASSYINTISTLLGKQIAQLVQANVVRFFVEPAHQNSATSTADVHLNVCIRSSCTFLPALFLRWAVDLHGAQSDGSEGVEEQFSATEFLGAVAAHGGERGARAVRLSAELVTAAGISTTLRHYQLQGVDWMFRKITESAITAQDGGKCDTEDSDLCRYLQGWWRLPTPPSATLSSPSCSSSSSSSNSSVVQEVWYNLLSEELKVGTDPSTAMSIDMHAAAGEANTRPGRGLILADEMGVGKSLQIITLIALLKHDRQQRATTIAAIAVSANQPLRKSTVPVEEEKPSLSAAASSVPVQIPSDGYFYDSSASDSVAPPSRPCLCGSADDLRRRDQRALGWIQCSSCDTWLHAPCAGFHSAEDMRACDVFVCLACSCLQTYSAPVPSHTALIVMPNTLINQWKAELLKHTTGVTFNNPTAPVGLKVFIYPDGLGSEQGCDYGRVDPRQLAQYDIVLMSFRALQKGYHEANVDYSSARIQRSSYAVYPPPFLCVQFGLLVVDETQNIETQTTSQILTMACRIPSVHRISVSGTPLGSGRLSDLYSLCQFLRAAPLCERRTWMRLIDKPAMAVPVSERLELLQAFFADFTLRRTKNLIHEQLGLPQHAVLMRPLHFSTFEVSSLSFGGCQLALQLMHWPDCCS
jgi:hypothetical protein